MISVFISPHPDDVAFCCLAALWRAKDQAVLLTVFSESQWTAAAGYEPATRAQTTATRRREDRDFAADIGCRYHDLGLPDSGVRGYSDAACYQSSPGADAILAIVRQRLAQCDAFAAIPDRVFIPLGHGNHIDHLIVREAAKAVWESRTELCFYEDLPYASRLSLEEITRQATETLGVCQPVCEDLTSLAEQKMKALFAYPSQLGPTTVERILVHLRRISPIPDGMAERYWRRAD